MKLKKQKSIKFDEHFANFLLKLCVAGIILLAVLWVLDFIIPLVMPFIMLLVIFTIFVYPIIKIKEYMKKRGQ